jgi:hypothetical protein
VLKAYRDSLAIAERLSAADRSNTDWQHNLSFSNGRVGDVLRAQGKLDDALKSYRDSLAILQRLVASDLSTSPMVIEGIGGLAYDLVLARDFTRALGSFRPHHLDRAGRDMALHEPRPCSLHPLTRRAGALSSALWRKNEGR